ncbi:MBL fold metallo-hydrolase [Natronolimnohabitans innermongolicus]|uniref:Beta-lactamase n=1 Tax=Natronolimnohabitans innermongolicus JCM 12255 TaxID=1227499 RepID=L9XK79_9EURY|nr:MBL fold metallo-hydrolase [Natronolimnohabitans innermongolicus]ELY62184.1 beta-lactamase [Natronolimnohabitans innermongolicus JCM 12255]
MTRDSVRRIGVGSGSPEGKNSAYLVDERVVVDPGPPDDDAWADLTDGLERADVSLTDLEAVLVTHWHVDHAGLAPRLADAAGATLAMGAGDAPLVADYGIERERRLERDRETMRYWGVPADAVERVVAGDTPSPMPESISVERLADGDRLAGLEAVATPGHTLGHTAFARDDALLVGDAVLPTYTPNVGGSDTRTLAPESVQSVREGGANDGAARRTDPLADFLETLDRLADRSERLLPGHGTSLAADRIETVRDHHEERSARVLEVLERRANEPAARAAADTDETADRTGTTPWTIARDLFGDLGGSHVKFGAGEAAAHCRHLERRGLVGRRSTDPVRYVPLD